MTTNPFFNFHDSTLDQNLLNSLTVEGIQAHGRDFVYIARDGDVREVYREAPQSSYTRKFSIEMFIKSVDGYGGSGQFLSQFGIEIRNEIVLSVSKERWTAIAPTAGVTSPRPLEGDLVYFAADNKLLVIKRVNQYELFYQLGNLYTWELTCEVFEYSHEVFNTGIPQIDNINQLSMSTKEHGSITLDGPIFDQDYIQDLVGTARDTMDDTSDIEEVADGIIDFDIDNPFSEKF